jgi:alkylation response protein AidB-like acyl-CoA dehydrogenase
MRLRPRLHPDQRLGPQRGVLCDDDQEAALVGQVEQLGHLPDRAVIGHPTGDQGLHQSGPVPVGAQQAAGDRLPVGLGEARDLLGGNGILLDFHVIRHMTDIESIHTYEGTESMQTLIVGRDITGISAFA